MLNSAQVNSRIKEDLEYEFTNKKRLSLPKYSYFSTPAGENYFCEAALLCEKFNLHPAQYIDIMWKHMGDNKVEFFSPAHIRGNGALKAINEYFEENKNYEIEITNANIDYNDMWFFQKNSVMQYLQIGVPLKDILMDSSLKFPAWFRILSTESRDPDIIDKYKAIAKKELNNALIDFIKLNNLDMNRILD
jgi:hypothetical protein